MDQIIGEVSPCGVGFFNEGDFTCAQPAFQLFFAGKGIVDVAKMFEVNEAVDVVVGDE